MEPHKVIDEANQHPMKGGFNLNLIPDDPIEENNSATNENIAPSSANLGILQGHDVLEVDFDWEALEFKTVKDAESFYR
ncbi:hypothetical protein LINPERPRIM_LOCUS24316, partial [Linum perenne]